MNFDIHRGFYILNKEIYDNEMKGVGYMVFQIFNK